MPTTREHYKCYIKKTNKRVERDQTRQNSIQFTFQFNKEIKLDRQNLKPG